MNPDTQALIEQAQQAQANARLLGQIAFGCIVTCAVFSMLGFWKLWQISKTLESFKTEMMVHLAFAQSRNEALAKTAGAGQESAGPSQSTD